MTPNEFLFFRKKLSKSQKKLSQLLGVSIKSTQNYETGRCPIPHHVERLLFFLVARIKKNTGPIVPCWVVKNCPDDRKLKCPAWEFQAGTFCWFINGTICQCSDQTTWEEKIKICRKCSVLISHGITTEEALVYEKDNFKKQIDSVGSFDQIIGKDNQMRMIYNLIQDVSNTDSIVLLKGAKGVGKKLISNTIHLNSHRSAAPYITVQCSGYPEQLLEAKLFGYEKGAFPGALNRKKGRLEKAAKGTILLESVDKIPLPIQIKLHQVLQTNSFRQLGGTKDIHFDGRLIVSTNQDLSNLVKIGDFSDAFFQQINIIPITVPDLRKRQNDIPLLANYLLKRFSSDLGKEIQGFDSEAMQHLINYHWPGNVSELENCIEQAVVLSTDDLISLKTLPTFYNSNANVVTNVTGSITDNEKKLLMNTLLECNGNKKKTAERLRISRSTLYAKLRKYEIK